MEPDEEIPDGHCRDGLGVAQACVSAALFPYLDLIAIDGKDQEPTFVLVDQFGESEPLFDLPCEDGLAGPFPCENMDLLAYLPLEDIGGGRGSDMWGWTDPETEREYVLMGRNNGTSFVDITTPTEPIYLGELPTGGTTSPWRDIKVYKDHAFIVADFNSGHGMQVFDLTELRDVITTTALITSTDISSPTVVYTPTIFSSTARYDEFSRAHNIAINEESGYAYTVGGETCRSGLHMINIQDPLAPVNSGCYGEDDYTHDAQCVRYRGPDLAYNDREICFNSNVDTLTIVDVTDKENPLMLSRVGSDGYDFDFAYFHQSWLTEDQRYLLSDDEVDESKYSHNTRTHIWDVSDLQNPFIVDIHTSDVEAIDHNLYIRGSYVFEANYMSGLRILSLDDVANGNLTEVAYLDTFPEVDVTTTGSAWSVYPYYKSGVVAVSTIEDGLFILQPHLPPEFSATAPDNMLNHCASSGDNVSGAVVDEPIVSFENALQLSAYNNYSGTVQLNLEPANPSIVVSQTQVTLTNSHAIGIDLDVDLNGLALGVHPFQLAVNDGMTNTVVSYEFGLHRSVPESVLLNNEEVTTTIPEMLFWGAADGAIDYLVEVSEVPDFSTIDYAEWTRESQIRTPDLFEVGREYYWRVQASNGCGVSQLSEVAAMQIGQLIYVPIVQ